MDTRRKLIYAVAFSVVSFVISAALSLGVGGYVLNVFFDPILNLTLPLIVVMVGIQAINDKMGPLYIGLITAVLFIVFFLPFITIPWIIIAVVVEFLTRKIGYRGLKAVVTYTTITGALEGILSVALAVSLFTYLLPKNVPMPTPTDWAIFSIIMIVESAVMGFISHYLGQYFIKVGIIK